MNGRLNKGETLVKGQGIFSKNGKWLLVLQLDGNLLLYNNQVPIWSSSTETGSRFVMEENGNVILYDDQGKVLFSTSTNNGQHFELLNTGFMVVYDFNGKSIWSSLKLQRNF